MDKQIDICIDNCTDKLCPRQIYNRYYVQDRQNQERWIDRQMDRQIPVLKNYAQNR